MPCCTYWNCCCFVPELPQTAVPFLGRVPMISIIISVVGMKTGPVVIAKCHQFRSYSQQSENEPVAVMLPAIPLRSLLWSP